MIKYEQITSALHTKDEFARIVNSEYVAAGQPEASHKEIDETYAFYRRLHEEDAGEGKLTFEVIGGKVEAVFGSP